MGGVCDVTDFEALARHGIRDIEASDKILDLSATKVEQLNEQLTTAVRESLAVDGLAEGGVFDFSPNSALGASLGACHRIACRADRMDELARFAIMWADSVQLTSYFEIVPEEAPQEFKRAWLHGSVQTLFAAEAAIRAGILRLIPTYTCYCPRCIPEVRAEMDRLGKSIGRVRRYVKARYASELAATFHSKARIMDVEVQGPEELLPHGVTHAWSDRPASAPAWLPQTIRERAERGEIFEYRIPGSRFKQSSIIDDLARSVVFDVIHQHHAASFRKLNYLTDRAIDLKYPQ